ncbi:hypothetical protein ACQP0C_03280 [Nocardia sp. CA-129566]|uniref:hypothetical protein n=1 Tax=Nocardia sp. CA-129566 TaxID=3239976 RepID=UPI003D98F725
MADRVKQHMLDRLLRIAAERAAAPSGIRFTERQLYYEVCRILTPVHRIPRRFAFTVPAPLTYASFRAALDRHGEVPGLLTIAPPKATPAGRHTPEPDLFDYGLPRLLVCESDAIAQMLRANGLPMESACPVLSAAELPLDPGIAGMLASVQGTIYLLHDASATGLTFPARLRELTEIPDDVRVVPLGLRPRQAGTLHLPHVHGPLPNLFAAQVDSMERAQLRHGPALNAEATQSDQCQREELDCEPGSNTIAAQVDSTERAQLRHGPALNAEATQRDQCQREELDCDFGSNTIAAQVDLSGRAQLRRDPAPGAEAAQVDSWEREESDARAPSTFAEHMGPTQSTQLRRGRASSAEAAESAWWEGEEPYGDPALSAIVAQLDSWERTWLLRGRYVEVEAVRPASLLRTVHRLVREVRPPRPTFTELRRARNAGFLTWPAA